MIDFLFIFIIFIVINILWTVSTIESPMIPARYPKKQILKWNSLLSVLQRFDSSQCLCCIFCAAEACETEVAFSAGAKA